MRVASLLAVLAFASGCGLVLDTAPPDPKPDVTTPPATCTADADCNDGNVCNGIEGCVSGSCVVTGSLDCDDHIGCTTDTCDATRNACVHAANPSVCTAGAICDPSASPTVTPTGCVVPKACTADDQCRDANPCNGVETCLTGHCVPGAPVVCPSNGCQVGSCAPDGSCTHVANAAACEDGVACTTGTCSALGTCTQTRSDSACADPYSCTKDLCAGLKVGTDATGCIHYTDDSACQGANAPVCVASVCAPAGAPRGSATGCAPRLVLGACAPGSRCNFAKDACEPLPTDCNACDDGNPCNGIETCVTNGTDAGIVDSGILDSGIVVIDSGITPLDSGIIALDASVLPPAPGTGGGTCVTTVDGCGPAPAIACRELYCNVSSDTPVCATRVSPDTACWALPTASIP